ncbi:GntP family permease [Jiulongibacter sp. NS-SX5]|uniref:GntP family permease n=1 Tax=Jiulongibacter sp. NS-SX5 TaxID=3463854 RepID=UPI00405A4651
MSSLLIILLATALVLFCIVKLKLHAAISLLLGAVFTALCTSPEMIAAFAMQKGLNDAETLSLQQISLGKKVAQAFGNTSAKVGILVALASVIGAALMRSGAAERIIRSILKIFGKQNSSLAMLTGSFTLAIPVFFDTVFYLMIPLVKSLSIRNPKKFSLYLMATIAGGVMAHSLIPPTPGPLFVAEEMGIDLGAMIIGGLVVGIITILAGYLYAIWANKKWDLPVRDATDVKVADLQNFSAKTNNELPGLAISILPVLLPILLITGNTFSEIVFPKNVKLISILKTIGDANFALLISALVAMWLLWSQVKDHQKFKSFISEALSSAGMIILITSAGGAFGQMLQQTGIGAEVANLAGNFQIALLPMAFFVTALVRSAQGSATVAMITAMGVMSGVVNDQLAFHPVYLALAIGCGSKIFAWMNDSAFWIITKMSGMKVNEAIRHFSMLLVVMALAGLVAVMTLSILFPFV